MEQPPKNKPDAQESEAKSLEIGRLHALLHQLDLALANIESPWTPEGRKAKEDLLNKQREAQLELDRLTGEKPKDWEAFN